MISLSFMAWVGVVLIQAVLHFVIIGRLRKKQRLFQERENGAIDVDTLSHEKTDLSARCKSVISY